MRQQTIVILLAQFLVPIWSATIHKPNGIDGQTFDSLFSPSQSRRPIEISFVPSKSNQMFLFLLNQTANGLEPVPFNNFNNPNSDNLRSFRQVPSSVVNLIPASNTNSNLLTNQAQPKTSQVNNLHSLSEPIPTSFASSDNINLTNLIEDPFKSVPYRSSEETINSLIEGIFSDVSLQSLPPEEILFGKLPTRNITSAANFFNDSNNISNNNNKTGPKLIPIRIEEVKQIERNPIRVVDLPRPATETPVSIPKFTESVHEEPELAFRQEFPEPAQEKPTLRQEFRQPTQEEPDFSEFSIISSDYLGFGQKLNKPKQVDAVPPQRLSQTIRKKPVFKQEPRQESHESTQKIRKPKLPAEKIAFSQFPRIETVARENIALIPTQESSNQSNQNQILFRLFQPTFNLTQTVPDFSSLTKFVTLQDYPPLTSNVNNQVNYALFRVSQEPAPSPRVHAPAPTSAPSPTPAPAPIPALAQTFSPVPTPIRRPLGRRRFSQINLTNSNKYRTNFLNRPTSTFARKGIDQQQPVNPTNSVPEKVAKLGTSLPATDYYYANDHGTKNVNNNVNNNDNTNNNVNNNGNTNNNDNNNVNNNHLPTLVLGEIYEDNISLNRAAVSLQNNNQDEWTEEKEEVEKAFETSLDHNSAVRKSSRPVSVDLNGMVNLISLPNYKFYMGNKSG